MMDIESLEEYYYPRLGPFTIFAGTAHKTSAEAVGEANRLLAWAIDFVKSENE